MTNTCEAVYRMRDHDAARRWWDERQAALKDWPGDERSFGDAVREALPGGMPVMSWIGISLDRPGVQYMADTVWVTWHAVPDGADKLNAAVWERAS